MKRFVPGLIHTGINVMPKLSQSNWTQQRIADIFLFYAEDKTNITNQISGGKIYNQVLGSVDYLTIPSGTGLNTIYQTPDNATYRTADSDYCWWKLDSSSSITDGNRLIAYDFTRTIIKYGNISPYTITIIAILKTGRVLTTKEENFIRDYFQLSIWWNNVSSDHGMTKGNRTGEQSAWIAESVSGPAFGSAQITDANQNQVAITFDVALDNTSIPAVTAYSVLVNSVANVVTSVAISGTLNTLTLTKGVPKGATITVAYTKPATNKLKALSNGAESASFTAQAVTNNGTKYLHDTFTDTNGTHLNVHVMDIGSGWTESTGSWNTQGNQCNEVTEGINTRLLIDRDTADYDIYLDCIMPSGTPKYAVGIVFRYQDATHGWQFILENDASSPYYTLNKDGSLVGSNAVTSIANSTVTIRVLASGNSIKTYINGVLKHDITDSAYNNKVTIGIVKYWQTSASYVQIMVDNFIVK